MEGADAAMRQTARAVGDFIVNVGSREHRLVQVAEPFFVESALDSALAIDELLVYLGVHSKSLSVAVDDGVVTSSDAAERQRISSFFQPHSSPKRDEFACSRISSIELLAGEPRMAGLRLLNLGSVP